MMITSILLMAGKGERMNKDINKVLLELGNKKIFEYSLYKLLKYTDEVICVVSKNDYDEVIKLLPSEVKVTIGGKTRGESVFNGLKMASYDNIIIHDSARPFLDEKLLKDIKKDFDEYDAILTYNECKDTIYLNDLELNVLNRDKLIRAITPQCGKKDILIEAYMKAVEENKTFTDDISLILNYYPNIKISTIKASDNLFKITTPIDYELAKLIWREYD